MHPRLEVKLEEQQRLVGIGFAPFPWKDRFALPLPCPKLAGAGTGTDCEVYPHRPKSCRGYRCKLLRAFAADELSLDQSVEVAVRARKLWQTILADLGAGDGEGIWSAVSRHRDQQSLPAGRAGLRIATLLSLIRRRFADSDFAPYR